MVGPVFQMHHTPGEAAFLPGCRSSAFSDCSTEEIVIANEHSNRQTDRTLTGAVAIVLRTDLRPPTTLHGSDHGESLCFAGAGRPRAAA